MRKSDIIFIGAVIFIIILMLLAPKGQKNTKNVDDSNAQISYAVSEDKAYSNLKEEFQIPIYRATYTAGYAYINNAPADISWISVAADHSIWYKKGNSYFHIFNGMSGDFEGLDDKIYETSNGKKVKFTLDGKAAIWFEVTYHTGFGIDVKDNALSKEEMLKIIDSMQAVK